MADPAVERYELGPAMRALNERQRAFVVAFFGAPNASAAARRAGYSGTGLKVQAWRLMHDPKVLAALHEEARVRDVGLLVKANIAADEILEDREHRDRAKVALAVRATNGLGVISRLEIKHDVKIEATVNEQFAELIRLGKRPEEVLANLPADEKAKVLELAKKEDGSYGSDPR